MAETKVDLGNDQGIGVMGDDIVVLMPARKMSKQDALRHAAWIVAIADRSENHAEFLALVEAIESI